MVDICADEFDAAVGYALTLIPPDLMALVENVAVFIDDEPPTEEPDLLGLYEGTPLPERDGSWALPDRITVFAGPLSRMCDTREQLIEEITVTIIHEVAHYFGIDDERLHELGWG
ncbi:MAG: metallopeptidase family protein [Nostocoides sp.]